MAVPERVKNKMKELGLSGVNKSKATPSHKTKSHVVMAKENDRYRLVRFGQQGVKGAGKNPKTKAEKARRRSYYARHNAQDPNPSKLSARYWSNKEKW
jgi:tRNA(Ile2) C34 agmatinyltransferase TiaS